MSIGVTVVPGLIELTLILNGAHSTANCLVSARTPPLLAAYAACVGAPLWAETDAMLIIFPCPCLIICLPTAWQHKNTPLRLTSMVLFQSASESSSAGTSLAMAASGNPVSPVLVTRSEYEKRKKAKSKRGMWRDIFDRQKTSIYTKEDIRTYGRQNPTQRRRQAER